MSLLISWRGLATLFMMTALVTATSNDASAEFIFDLTNQAGTFDDETTATFANNSGSGGTGIITGEFESFGGEMNSNASTFGINDKNSNTDDVDAIEGSELLEVTFDRDIFLTGLDLVDFTGSERVELTIGDNTPLILAPSGGSIVYAFSSDNLILQGQVLRFEATAGDFSIQSFTAVPEPSSLGLIVLASIWFRRRRSS